MIVTTIDGEELDTEAVLQVDFVYDNDGERAVRVFFDNFDGNASNWQFRDPDGAVYQTFKKAGIPAYEDIGRWCAPSTGE